MIGPALIRAFAFLLCLLAASAAPGQGWPTRPIRIINGNAPGGSADVSVRVVGDAVARALGQAVIVENRPGASGGIAMDTVARAVPDGYTLLVSADSSLYQTILKPSLPYTIEMNFTPIVILTTQPLVLAAHFRKPSPSPTSGTNSRLRRGSRWAVRRRNSRGACATKAWCGRASRRMWGCARSSGVKAHHYRSSVRYAFRFERIRLARTSNAPNGIHRRCNGCARQCADLWSGPLHAI